MVPRPVGWNEVTYAVNLIRCERPGAIAVPLACRKAGLLRQSLYANEEPPFTLERVEELAKVQWNLVAN